MVRFSIIVTALIALAAPAHARCNQPYAPTVKLPPNATARDVVTLRGDVAAFIAASDLYQKCLLASGATDLQVSASQMLKKKVGAQFNETLRAFKAANPGV